MTAACYFKDFLLATAVRPADNGNAQVQVERQSNIMTPWHVSLLTCFMHAAVILLAG
jgi:hypothetical protein